MSLIDSFSELIFNVYEAFSVVLLIKDGERFRCLSSVTFAKSFDRDRTVPIEGTLPGWVLKHNEPLIIPNFDKDESTLGYYGSEEGIKSFMAYPLEAPGVIVVDSKKRYVFTDREKKLLGHFVSMIGKELEKEKRLQELEEKNEELSVERRIIRFLLKSGLSELSLEEVLEECLALCRGDFCFIGVERKGKLVIVDCAGNEANNLRLKECPMTGTVASMVLEGRKEFLLPHGSGYLREKPLLFSDDGVKARQFFGFPLLFEEEAFGLAGFVSLSDASLRDGIIGVLRDISALLSLYLIRTWTKGALEGGKYFDPVTGALLFAPFFNRVEAWVREKKGFSVVSVRVPSFHAYNRLLGVEAADRVLRKIVQSVEQCLGKTALVTKAEVSHFYAVTRDPQALEAQNMTRVLNYTILSAVADSRIETKGALRIGVAEFPEDGESLWALLDRADERGERQSYMNKGARV
ncbi:MAG TPA: GAF domain-containing protein [Syntrophorhabdales bacterium]|nr:GAF domain-containing protein [Syntrophorhabdales bacterium]